jgi:4-diphosphocytidyl-2-C-methyl-D-erythritol kinase
MGPEKTSHCKVNLLLNILGRRADGFHELETVMQPVNLCDTLRFDRGGSGVQLTCSDARLPVDGSNLVQRAATAFLAAAGIGEGVVIHLEKRIPLAAGLGGGSGNAAATLLGMNELFGGPLANARLNELAAALGSDVPFFLQDQPALAVGRGERVTGLAPFAALQGKGLLLIHPGFGVSTAWAYGALKQFPGALNGRPGRAAALIAALDQSDFSAAANQLYNSLEAPVLRKYPLLVIFQEFLREQGALAALMSGSGSTTFAITASLDAARLLEEKFRTKFGPNLWTAALPL